MITVYVDVLFMINLIVNILILEATGLIMREETKWQKSLLSASFGALYATVIFFARINSFLSLFSKIIVSLALVFLCFGFVSKKRFLRLLSGFYISSFIFGGSMIAVLSLTDIGAKMGAVYSNGAFYMNIPWQLLFSSSAITYFLIMFFARVRKRKIEKQAIFRDLTIYIQGREINIKAIIDTGNSLCDPITGMPVIVCEYGSIKPILPNTGDTLLEKMVNAHIKVRMIPFSTVGKENGVMVGFLPDRTEVDKCETKKCIVGISENKLSSDATYHALLNPLLISGKAM